MGRHVAPLDTLTWFWANQALLLLLSGGRQQIPMFTVFCLTRSQIQPMIYSGEAAHTNVYSLLFDPITDSTHDLLGGGSTYQCLQSSVWPDHRFNPWSTRGRQHIPMFTVFCLTRSQIQPMIYSGEAAHTNVYSLLFDPITDSTHDLLGGGSTYQCLQSSVWPDHRFNPWSTRGRQHIPMFTVFCLTRSQIQPMIYSGEAANTNVYSLLFDPITDSTHDLLGGGSTYQCLQSSVWPDHRFNPSSTRGSQHIPMFTVFCLTRSQIQPMIYSGEAAHTNVYSLLFDPITDSTHDLLGGGSTYQCLQSSVWPDHRFNPWSTRGRQHIPMFTVFCLTRSQIQPMIYSGEAAHTNVYSLLFDPITDSTHDLLGGGSTYQCLQSSVWPDHRFNPWSTRGRQHIPMFTVFCLTRSQIQPMIYSGEAANTVFCLTRSQIQPMSTRGRQHIPMSVFCLTRSQIQPMIYSGEAAHTNVYSLLFDPITDSTHVYSGEPAHTNSVWPDHRFCLTRSQIQPMIYSGEAAHTNVYSLLFDPITDSTHDLLGGGSTYQCLQSSVWPDHRFNPSSTRGRQHIPMFTVFCLTRSQIQPMIYSGEAAHTNVYSLLFDPITDSTHDLLGGGSTYQCLQSSVWPDHRFNPWSTRGRQHIPMFTVFCLTRSQIQPMIYSGEAAHTNVYSLLFDPITDSTHDLLGGGSTYQCLQSSVWPDHRFNPWSTRGRQHIPMFTVFCLTRSQIQPMIYSGEAAHTNVYSLLFDPITDSTHDLLGGGSTYQCLQSSVWPDHRFNPSSTRGRQHIPMFTVFCLTRSQIQPMIYSGEAAHTNVYSLLFDPITDSTHDLLGGGSTYQCLQSSVWPDHRFNPWSTRGRQHIPMFTVFCLTRSQIQPMIYSGEAAHTNVYSLLFDPITDSTHDLLGGGSTYQCLQVWPDHRFNPSSTRGRQHIPMFTVFCLTRSQIQPMIYSGEAAHTNVYSLLFDPITDSTHDLLGGGSTYQCLQSSVWPDHRFNPWSTRGRQHIPMFTVFCLTRSQIQPMIYSTRGENANYYITDAIPSD